MIENTNSLYQEVVGTLCARDYKGVGSQYVSEDKLILSKRGLDSMNKNTKVCGVVSVDYTVRRLTPLECERLQGYPDGWTLLPQITEMDSETYSFWCSVLLEKAKIEEKARWNEVVGIYEIWREVKQDDTSFTWVNTEKPYKHKTRVQMLNWYNKMVDSDRCDSVRYKVLGNSIALPPWEYVLQRLSICCGEDVTMASLFDGIGGFPLIWERLNGAGSCLWSSEIDVFPIAVTMCRFNESKNQNEFKWLF